MKTIEKHKKHPKVEALFEFIEFLYSNIDNFNQYNSLIIELEEHHKIKPYHFNRTQRKNLKQRK